MIGLNVANQLASCAEVSILDYAQQIQRVWHYLDPSIHKVYGSILDESVLSCAMKDCDIVIHLAAMLGVKRTEQDKLRCFEVNVCGTHLVVDHAVKAKVGKIVLASSSEVYGEPVENPVNETTMTQGKTCYALSKLAGEEICKAYSQRYGIKYSILRYFNCYGPFQVAHFVVPRFILNVMNDTSPIIYGDGKQLRCYTFAEDTAMATVKAALSTEANNQVFNIGRGDTPISLIDLAQLVIKLGNKDGVIVPIFTGDFSNADRSKDREIFERYSIPNKAEEVLDWRPEFSLTQGIQNIFEKGQIFEEWTNG